MATLSTPTQAADTGYSFDRSFPSGETAQKAYDDSDLNTPSRRTSFSTPPSRSQQRGRET